MAALEVDNLRIALGGRVLVDEVSFAVPRGERTCLLGPSGSGKSLIARAVVGQLPPGAVASGSIRVRGIEVLGVPTALRPDDARAAMVFQDSAVALNPLVRLREQLAYPLRKRRGLSRPGAIRAAAALLESVGLPPELIAAFPQELSGGQRQRACIALALACEAGLLVADEPTTALDVVTQSRVLGVLSSGAAASPDVGMLFITHDIAVAAAVCSRAVVLLDGRIAEQGKLAELVARPGAASTHALVRAARAASLDRLTAMDDDGATPPAPPQSFFDLERVSKVYPPSRRRSRPSARAQQRVALRETDLAVGPSERVGVVGVSGSGKTTLLRLMLGLDRSSAGVVRCAGREISPASARSLRWYRRRVQYIPQDPANTLDPLMSVQDLVAEPLIGLGHDVDRPAAVIEALESVGLERTHLRRRRNELSGGQAQRVAIARAIVTRPDFLLADEPVSGVDLPTRERVVGLLSRLADERGMGLLVVSHDLSVVASLCDRTLVMHAGDVVEDRPTLDLIRDPSPRTRELIAAVPALPL